VAVGDIYNMERAGVVVSIRVKSDVLISPSTVIFAEAFVVFRICSRNIIWCYVYISHDGHFTFPSNLMIPTFAVRLYTTYGIDETSAYNAGSKNNDLFIYVS
jgi:hypothetical protein